MTGATVATAVIIGILLFMIGIALFWRDRKLRWECELANSLLEIWGDPEVIPCRCGRSIEVIECPCRLAMLRVVTRAHLRKFVHRAPEDFFQSVFGPHANDEESEDRLDG